jgi:hypothetical protein
VLGTLLVHGLALNSVGWGFSTVKPKQPETQAAGAARVETAVKPAEALVLLNLNNAPEGDSDLAELHRSIASWTPRLTHARVEVVSPEFFDIGDSPSTDNASVSNPDAGDPALRALMVGRYLGQINARIERAWMRPRTPVEESVETTRLATNAPSGDTFTCRVQIRQDGRGNVQEVLLLACNGSEAWRHSLVVAINQASPLPAPPVPSVYTQSLTMSFQAQAYTPEMPADQYETDRIEGTRP